MYLGLLFVKLFSYFVLLFSQVGVWSLKSWSLDICIRRDGNIIHCTQIPSLYCRCPDKYSTCVKGVHETISIPFFLPLLVGVSLSGHVLWSWFSYVTLLFVIVLITVSFKFHKSMFNALIMQKHSLSPCYSNILILYLRLPERKLFIYCVWFLLGPQ